MSLKLFVEYKYLSRETRAWSLSITCVHNFFIVYTQVPLLLNTRGDYKPTVQQSVYHFFIVYTQVPLLLNTRRDYKPTVQQSVHHFFIVYTQVPLLLNTRGDYKPTVQQSVHHFIIVYRPLCSWTQERIIKLMFSNLLIISL